MTNQRDASLSSSSIGVNARTVCVDSKLSRGSSSFFTSRGAGAGAVATTTCCSDVSLLAMGLVSAARNFGQDLRAGATGCVRTGAAFAASIGAALLGAAAWAGGGMACLGGGAIAFDGGAISRCGGALMGVATATVTTAGAAAAGGGGCGGGALILGATT